MTVNLVSKALGPLPIINRFRGRLRLASSFDQFVPCNDQRQKLSPVIGFGLLFRNILVARRPLYGVGEWAKRFDEGCSASHPTACIPSMTIASGAASTLCSAPSALPW